MTGGPPGGQAPVADAVAPPPSHPRFPLIDGMRAIAVISVVAVHVAVFGGAINDSFGGRLLGHLNIGVTIFFLISGFLLYRPFIAHRAGGPVAPAALDYAKRRFLRIYPAYWFALTLLVVIPGLTGVVGGEGLLQYGLLQSLPLAEGGGCTAAPSDCGLAQTWSLVVELTFYAVLPLYVFAAARIPMRGTVRRWMASELGLLAALSVLSLVFRFLLVDGGQRSWFGGSVLGFVFWFSLGMGIAIVSVGLSARDGQPRSIRLISRRPLLPWGVALAGYVGLCLWLPPSPFFLSETEEFVGQLAFGVIAALLLLPAVFGDDAGGAPRRLLANPAIAWLGLVSYGIFLWHYAIVLELGVDGEMTGFWLFFAAATALSVACAAVSYYVIERPFLRLKHQRLRAARKSTPE